MSGLKAINAYRLTTNTEDSDVYIHNDEFGCGGDLVECYLKSEADKVINFWRKESHDHYERWFNLNNQYEGWLGKVMRCERAERELRNQKYKRCLAKKAECKVRSVRYQDLWEKWRKTESDTSGSYYRNYIKWWHRAMKWRHLAEKFKTTNSTAR